MQAKDHVLITDALAHVAGQGSLACGPPLHGGLSFRAPARLCSWLDSGQGHHGAFCTALGVTHCRRWMGLNLSDSHVPEEKAMGKPHYMKVPWVRHAPRGKHSRCQTLSALQCFSCSSGKPVTPRTSAYVAPPALTARHYRTKQLPRQANCFPVDPLTVR